MRRLMMIVEAHHAYDHLDYNTKFEPFKSGDTVRVFHGFYSMTDAARAAAIGLSGMERVGRRYSYEADNNPRGLYVTLKLDVAKEFTSRGAIIEFTARWDELEAPVWPGGSYTVPGQMAQYFGHGAAGRAARNARRRIARGEALASATRDPDDMGHVPLSDDPHRAYVLTQAREYQALFVGHLDPSRIAAVYVSDDPSKDGRWALWSRLTRDEFIAAHADEVAQHSQDRRMFAPDDPFNGPEWLRRMIAEYGRETVEHALRTTAADMRADPKRANAAFMAIFGNFLWPKQYAPAMLWLLRTYAPVR